MTTLYKRLCFVSVLLFICVFVAFPVDASTVGVAETYTLPVGDTLSRNAYLAGGTVIISGSIKGDAVIAGGSTTLSGNVGGDTLIGAGTVQVLGPVSGDFRALGGTITLAEKVEGDVSIVGGAISFLQESRVSGDVLIVGGKISLLGAVGGTVYIAGGNILIDGPVSGNVSVYSSGDITIGKNAVIAGDFTYRAAHEAIIETGAVINGKTSFNYTPPVVSSPDARGFFAGLFGLFFIVRLLVLIVAALFFVLVFRRASREFAFESRDHFWKSCLVGLAVLVSVPFATLILVLTIFGGVIAVALVSLWVFLLIIAQVYSGILAAVLFRVYILKRGLEPLVSWKSAILGVLGINIICLVPYVGFLVSFVFFLGSLGTLSVLGYRYFILSR